MNADQKFTGFEDLENWEEESKVTKADSKYSPTEKFPCVQCGGSGKYRGIRVHQAASQCFTCNGKGYFKTSPAARAKAKAGRVARKAKKEAGNVSDFAAQNESLYSYLQEVASWNSFAQSLLQSITKYGDLSPKQKASAVRMQEKHIAKQEAKAQVEANRPVVDLARVHELFATAQSNGIGKPRLRVGELTLSLAPSHGVNAGAIYVKTGSDYQGKVTRDNKFSAARNAQEGVEAQLVALAADPMKEAVAFGQKTGKCACCGRKLTNKESIRLGVGPVCLENWGF